MRLLYGDALERVGLFRRSDIERAPICPLAIMSSSPFSVLGPVEEHTLPLERTCATPHLVGSEADHYKYIPVRSGILDGEAEPAPPVWRPAAAKPAWHITRLQRVGPMASVGISDSKPK